MTVKKWRFQPNEKLYDEVLREAVVEAEADAAVWEQAVKLTEMLLPTVRAMLATGATPKQIAFVLRYMSDAGELAEEEQQ